MYRDSDCGLPTFQFGLIKFEFTQNEAEKITYIESQWNHISAAALATDIQK